MSFLGQTLPWLERPSFGRAPAANDRAGTALPRLWKSVSASWRRLMAVKLGHSGAKRLKLIEKVLLGDKQFVALLELDGQTFLASGGQGVPMNLTPSKGATPRAKRKAVTPKSVSPAAASAAGKKTVAAGAARKSTPKAVPARVAESASPAKRKPERAAPKSPKKASRPSAAVGKVLSENPRVASPREAEALPAVRRQNLKAVVPKTETARAAVICAEPVSPILPVLQGPEAVSPARKQRAASKPPHVPVEQIQDAREIGKTGFAAEKPRAARAVPHSHPEPARKEVPVPPFEDPGAPSASKLDTAAEPSASTAFAALLELRMLASEVFQEIESQDASALPEPQPPPQPRKSAAAERPSSSLPNVGLHRLRRRLSAFACLLVILLVPHATARALSLAAPIASPSLVSASWTALPARASPLLLSGQGIDFLAAARPSGDEIRISGLGGSSASWSIVVVLTLLTLLPSLLFCITPFARLLIVFHFLRQALGLQTTPSNQTLIGLSLILTFFLMQPTGETIYRDAIVPAQAGAITPLDAVVRAGGPMRHFMAHYVREKDAELFLEIAKEPRPRSVEDLSFRVLLPAYILSELKAGFQIGTVLFLPFLIVDMVVASITTSVGMMQLPPVVISTPLKLLLFLMVDGWHLLIGALMRSFN